MENNNLKCILTKGLISSGKSTWAKQFIKDNSDYIRLSKDDFRHMLDSYTFSNKTEKIITDMMESCIVEAHHNKMNIIIDEQHLNEKYLNEKIKWLQELGYEVEIKEFPITLAEAIERDKKRDFSIGEKVIKQTWRKYEIKLKQMIERHKPKYEWNGDLPYCLICDIDGTLATSNNRRIFDFKECVNDELIHPTWSILNRYKDSMTIILLSGREEICRAETEQWIRDKHIPCNFLYMRKEKDYRDDTIIKEELFNEHIRGKYQPLFVIDDRPSVCQKWVDMGLFVINVNQDPLCKNNF